MDESTERELLELLDRDRVVALMNRYFATVDERTEFDTEWARSLFAEDVHVAHRGIELNGVDDMVGGHNIVRGGWARTIHLATNPRVELDGDRAHVSARLLAIHLHPDGGPTEPYVIANLFDADVVRTPDGWRIVGFSQDTVWSSGRSHLDPEAAS